MITFMVIVIVITVTVLVIITIQHKLFSKTLENIRASLSVFEDFGR